MKERQGKYNGYAFKRSLLVDYRQAKAIDGFCRCVNIYYLRYDTVPLRLIKHGLNRICCRQVTCFYSMILLVMCILRGYYKSNMRAVMWSFKRASTTTR